MIANGTESNYFLVYLNATGALGGPIAASLPNCYSF